ncbi:3',5'-cyclic adenosine monophosphate phosphodiesterase CpdA [Streptomyces antimycoticus]
MTTGDNTDNNAKIELDWFLAAMNGGRITPNTGDPRHYEGVQNSGLKEFWHPEDALRDADKKLGFPRIDGFLEAALRTVNSPGLRLPWYSTIGNHDDLAGGVYSLGHNFYADFATGKRKLEIIPADDAERLFKGTRVGDDPKGVQMKALLDAHAKDMRTVTPDERRAPFTQTEYLAAHLDPAATGPGPVGHGYTEDNLEQGTLYYSFRVSENVIGISLDTTDPGGHYTGSLGTAQLRWLERTLKAHKDDYVIVFSHHYSRSLDNMNRDPAGRARPATAGTRSSPCSSATPRCWPGSTATATRTRSPRVAPSGRSPPPRMWTSPSWPGSSRSWTTTTARSPCSPRSSSRPRRTARTSRTCPRPGSRRSTASCPSTRPAPARSWPVT